MLQITEDTPPDMLAGAMDLTVHLPNGRAVKMSVERSTPMMDLLVQITTNCHLQLSGYTLQALEMAPSKGHGDNVLPYKPNTPIGALDTQNIRVIPKAKNATVPKNVPPGQKPFESTFRLKVHLPRNQLYVTRVSQSVYLEDVMNKVCDEKNLDSQKYEFRHPGNLDEILNPKLTLSDYAITEIYLVQRGSNNLHQIFSTGDIMSLRKEEERKQMHNKTGGGVFNLIFRRGGGKSVSQGKQPVVVDEETTVKATFQSTGSLSSENRSISPTHSDDSRSVTPPAVQPPSSDLLGPKPPQRKRRPAPKPPTETKKTELTICHSRNSSDSSGYHEASVLSDNCNTSLPRRPKSTVIAEPTLSAQHSQSTSNLSAAKSKSTSNLHLPGRKKKAPPPPPAPVLKSEKTETNLEEPSPVVASQSCTVAQTESAVYATHSLENSSLEQQPQPEEVTPETEIVTQESRKDNELESEWQYQLPSPPKAFRDTSPVAFADVNQEDSVVTSPELFEKLKVVKDEKETVSDLTSMVSEEEKPILNKLSLENLEKRKSLVYNRELATSLKMADEERKTETFSSSLLSFEKTYDDVKKSSPKQTVSTSTLPNFKITTYNNPKQKLNIFEDDTVRSNTERGSKRNSFVEATFPLQKNYIGTSMENISFRRNSFGRNLDDDKNGDYKFFKPPPPKSHNVFRSESFTKEQKWTPFKPVTRSKSQVVLNKYNDLKKAEVQEDNLAKSNSLFDVSGLQSLEVMRVIQNKLNTPDASTERLDRDEPDHQVKAEEPRIEKPPVKTYVYSPPAINMSTWSERPKKPVNVKEDPDYKFGVKNTSSKLLVNTVTNDMKSYNSVEVRSKPQPQTFTNGVTVKVRTDDNKNVVKVNGFEPINRTSGNVVIKIGGDQPVFRKPLGNVNTDNPRPHSIAFGNDFDISRVPIVRSVEFKKPYKDFNNTSVTQIYNSNNPPRAKDDVIDQPKPKPVFRVNSFLQNSSTSPVVRGFRGGNEVDRKSWSQPHSFSTLPAKPKNYLINAPVPFSQSNLRRNENSSVPPPAPIMPKTLNSFEAKSRDNRADPKEQLLQAIRDFGGKKGLRAVKA